VIGGGHPTAAGLLQTLAPVRESSKDRPTMQSSKTDMVIFVDDRGGDGLAREGLWQHGNGGERMLGFQNLINEIPVGGGSFYRGFVPNNS
jgi:hypothetical protein